MCQKVEILKLSSVRAGYARKQITATKTRRIGGIGGGGGASCLSRHVKASTQHYISHISSLRPGPAQCKYNTISFLTEYWGVFTLTETETDKKWVVRHCVEVFVPADTDTVTDAMRFQTQFIALALCQCEHL